MNNAPKPVRDTTNEFDVLGDFLAEQRRDPEETRNEFAVEVLSMVRTARALTARGEPWPAWSSREYAAVAIVLDDHKRLAAEGLHTMAAAMRFVADGMTHPPRDQAAYFAGIRARAEQD